MKEKKEPGIATVAVIANEFCEKSLSARNGITAIYRRRAGWERHGG